MEKIYGEGPFSITLSTPALPGVTLHYSRLDEITDDISDARVYGGIPIFRRGSGRRRPAGDPHWRLHLQSQAPAGARREF